MIEYKTNLSSLYLAILSTLTSIMDISGRYKVDFRSPTSIRSLLGFKNTVCHTGYNELENIVNILTVNSMFVEVSMINGSYVNGKLNPVIYSSSPTLHWDTR